MTTKFDQALETAKKTKPTGWTRVIWWDDYGIVDMNDFLNPKEATEYQQSIRREDDVAGTMVV